MFFLSLYQCFCLNATGKCHPSQPSRPVSALRENNDSQVLATADSLPDMSPPPLHNPVKLPGAPKLDTDLLLMTTQIADLRNALEFIKLLEAASLDSWQHSNLDSRMLNRL